MRIPAIVTLLAALSVSSSGCAGGGGSSGRNVIDLVDVIRATSEVPAASVRWKCKYEGKTTDERYSLRLVRLCQDTGLVEPVEPEGQIRIKTERKPGSVVEIWSGRLPGSPGCADFFLVLQMSRHGNRGTVDKVCWVEELYSPPTSYWYLDLKDKGIEIWWPGVKEWPSTFEVTLPDSSTFPSIGESVLSVALGSHNISTGIPGAMRW